MKINKKLMPLAIAVMVGQTGLAGGLAYAETNAPATTTLEAELQDPAKQGIYRKEAEKLLLCEELSDPKAKAAAFAKLAPMKWDRKQMGCGVRYGFELAQAQPDNIELQLQALGALIEYFDVLDKSYSRLYSASPVMDIELSRRWTDTRNQSKALLAGVEQLSGQIAEVVALRGLYTLFSLQHEATEKEKIASPSMALPDLEGAVKMKPGVLDGGGLLALGTVLLTLPEFAGGDLERGIALLDQGSELSPQNLQIKTALIDAEISERNQPKALAVLKDAANISEQGQNEQDYADELRKLSGQAVRLEQTELAKQLQTRRELFLAAHPYLNKRLSTATAGHGGVDPFTGQDPENIQ
ncbi:hypothetical protein ACFPU0_07865 [Pseudomonas sp. GCM10022186]|uniref:hypothetical protein n=1 Tax=Pseudomonas sp. GCM10022186 TaxID=3252650 RepID=UPI00360D27C9